MLSDRVKAEDSEEQAACPAEEKRMFGMLRTGSKAMLGQGGPAAAAGDPHEGAANDIFL